MRKFLLASSVFLSLWASQAHAQKLNTSYPPGTTPNGAEIFGPVGQGGVSKSFTSAVIVGQTPIIPNGATTATTFAQFSSRTFNIKDYGAKLDCATDDSSAFTRAIAAANVFGGGDIVVPNACALVTAGFTVGANTRVRGEGFNSIIKAGSLTAILITISGANVEVSNLVFISAGQQTSGEYIRVANADNVFIDHFKMSGQWKGIQIDAGVATYVNDGRFNGNSPGGVTIEIDGGNDQYLTHLVSDNLPTGQPANGILITNNGATWIDSVDFIHSGNGLEFRTLKAGDALSWMFVSNSAFDTSSGCGILIDPIAGTVANGFTFTANWTSTNTNGVCTSGAGTIDGMTFLGHRSFNNYQRGMVFASGTNITIDTAQVEGNSGSSLGTYNGIEFGSGISGWSVRNSRIGAASTFPNSHSNNIAVDAGPSDNYAIQNNDLRGFVNNAIGDNGTGTNTIISGNLQ